MRPGRCTIRAIASLLLLSCGLSFTPPAHAQHTSRTLTGTVTDEQNEPLRGAVVQVHGEADGTIVSYITDKTGQYSFKRLDGDLDYSIWATWRGHRFSARKISLFDTSPAKVINLEIAR